MTNSLVLPRRHAARVPAADRSPLIAAVLLAALAMSAACQAAPSPTPSLPTTPAGTPLPSDALGSPPAGWGVYRDAGHGFGFWFPPQADLVQVAAGEDARVEFSWPDPTNVVEEALTVHAEQASDGCRGPLAQEFDPANLQSQDIQLSGIIFVKQIHSGAAAGTATTRVAYTTSRGSLCVSLDFVLSTFDVANLDPTQFPNPPASVDASAELQRFDDVTATFRWLP